MNTIKALPALTSSLYLAGNLPQPLLAQWATLLLRSHSMGRSIAEDVALRHPVMNAKNVDLLWTLGMLQWESRNGKLTFSAFLPCRDADLGGMPGSSWVAIDEAIKRVRGSK